MKSSAKCPVSSPASLFPRPVSTQTQHRKRSPRACGSRVCIALFTSRGPCLEGRDYPSLPGGGSIRSAANSGHAIRVDLVPTAPNPEASRWGGSLRVSDLSFRADVDVAAANSVYYERARRDPKKRDVASSSPYMSFHRSRILSSRISRDEVGGIRVRQEGHIGDHFIRLLLRTGENQVNSGGRNDGDLRTGRQIGRRAMGRRALSDRGERAGGRCVAEQGQENVSAGCGRDERSGLHRGHGSEIGGRRNWKHLRHRRISDTLGIDYWPPGRSSMRRSGCPKCGWRRRRSHRPYSCHCPRSRHRSRCLGSS